MSSPNDVTAPLVATRVFALVLLLLHCYINYYEWWALLELTHPAIGGFLLRFEDTLYFQSFYLSFSLPMVVLVVGSLADKAKKSEFVTLRQAVTFMIVGVVTYVAALLAYHVHDLFVSGVVYLALSVAGWGMFSTGLINLKRVLDFDPAGDIFNEENQSFPQEERLIENQYSVNLPTRYRLKNKYRKGWINVVNPFRGTFITGTPGSGKSYAVVKPFIRQMIAKGFTMFVYDYKFPELSTETYNALRTNMKAYQVRPKFYVINFDDLRLSHRCNPLDPALLSDITDATESARTILLNLNRNWIMKQGDFFVESPINFLTAVIWYLRLYQDGKYCTLPHVVQFLSQDNEKIFPILHARSEITTLVKPFYSAMKSGAVDQLEGQIASARIPLSRLASPQLYWVMSGDDFTLDLNNPEAPKVLCIGNNPDRQDIYGAAIGLYNSRVTRLINKKDRTPCAMIVDELPTIYFRGLDQLIATARSNKVAVVLACQDMAQLIRDYGDKVAVTVFNICANIISGQVKGSNAKDLADRFGKTAQVRKSYSQNRMDTSFSHSTVLQERIPASRIASLSQGEFVGTIADTHEQEIKLKTFDAAVTLDAAAISRLEKKHHRIPYLREVSDEEVRDNFNQITQDVEMIIETELQGLVKT